ncbi:C-type mannose receptor 2 [Plakobranchus ocellatus]|uniref:C-type mannose receptor 2 n=1 Tax=Plakobranchus ocellatus TaxID=259542 RepID=A0AAV3YVX6_9GAST|nr:C-type mannose receptor 2 [Plakobranchus ocellatus]
MIKSKKVGMTWLGLRDLNSGKKFYWLDETKEITYSNWATGYPQTVDKNGKDCVIMGGQGDGKWTIVSCISPISFFCERKPTCDAVGVDTLALFHALFSADGTCPVGWVKSPTSCIKLYDDKRRWQDARTTCQQDGGDLVRVHDDCMSKLIEEKIKSRPTDDIFWIGLNDQNEEGKWKWLDDDEPVIYKNWAPGQPSNHQVSGHKKGQDCAEIGSHKKTQWNDQDCTKAHKFICEKPAGSPPKAGVGIIIGIIVAVLALCGAILAAIFFGPRLYHYLNDKIGGKVSGPLSFNNPVADSIQNA